LPDGVGIPRRGQHDGSVRKRTRPLGRRTAQWAAQVVFKIQTVDQPRRELTCSSGKHATPRNSLGGSLARDVVDGTAASEARAWPRGTHAMGRGKNPAQCVYKVYKNNFENMEPRRNLLLSIQTPRQINTLCHLANLVPLSFFITYMNTR